MLTYARRAAPVLFRGVHGRVVARGVSSPRGFCDGATEEDTSASEAKAEEVKKFLDALGIESDKYVEKIPDMATLLLHTKTETLKKEGMAIKDRKKLLSHVEKYKSGLWAPPTGE